jgi:ADP-heptose:LPS heptosyltransferase
MARRILFVLRGKLGDTIVSFATVRAWADAFPEDELTVFVRANYAPLFAREAGVRVIGFSSRLAMFARAFWIRWFEAPFDALLVLLGAGAPIRRLGRIVRAARKVFLDARLAPVYPEWPEIPKDHYQPEPAWRVAALVSPQLPMPRAVRLPGLAALRRSDGAIGIAPVSDETRRTMGPPVVRELARALAARHAGRAIHILVNRADREARPLLAAGPLEGAALRQFPTIARLIEELAALEHLYTTDTGLYHLAVAMGVPTTVFYGPTQPWKNGMPAQPQLTRLRLAALGGEHCEEKRCGVAACLNHAVRLHAGIAASPELEGTPQGCLLRHHPVPALGSLSENEGPRR